MDIRQLKYFVKVVQLQSFTRAAQELCVAQPSLSTHVKNLEKELGGSLLIRTARGVKATALGERLTEEAETLVRQLERISSVLVQSKALTGRVAIGFAPSAAAMLLVPVVREVRRLHPAISLAIYEDMSSRLEKMIADGTLDMAVVYDAGLSAGLHSETIGTAGLELLCSPEFAVVSRDGISLRKALEFELILPDQTHHLRQLLEKLARSEKIKLKVTHECQSVSMILRLVLGGFGATILSQGVSADSFPHITRTQVRHAGIKNEVKLVWSQERTLTGAQDAVRRTLNDLACSLYPVSQLKRKRRPS